MLQWREAEREREGKKKVWQRKRRGRARKRAQQQIIFAPLPSKWKIHMSVLCYHCQVCGENKTAGQNNGENKTVWRYSRGYGGKWRGFKNGVCVCFPLSVFVSVCVFHCVSVCVCMLFVCVSVCGGGFVPNACPWPLLVPASSPFGWGQALDSTGIPQQLIHGHWQLKALIGTYTKSALRKRKQRANTQTSYVKKLFWDIGSRQERGNGWCDAKWKLLFSDVMDFFLVLALREGPLFSPKYLMSHWRLPIWD